MAGSRVNNYSPSTADLTSLMTTVDGERTGYVALSLTEYASTSRPGIAGGSIVDIDGALFRFSTTEAISTAGVTSTAAQMYYIRLVPTSSQCSAQFSTTAPSWREDLQGYYYSTTSNNRVVGATYFTGADYIMKTVYASQPIKTAVYVTYESTVSLSSVASQITGFTPDVDIRAEWSTVLNSFIPKESGVYRVNLELEISTSITVTTNIIALESYIYKNGSTFKRVSINAEAGGATAPRANIYNEIVCHALAGDIFTFYACELLNASSLFSRPARCSVQVDRVV